MNTPSSPYFAINSSKMLSTILSRRSSNGFGLLRCLPLLLEHRLIQRLQFRIKLAWLIFTIANGSFCSLVKAREWSIRMIFNAGSSSRLPGFDRGWRSGCPNTPPVDCRFHARVSGESLGPGLSCRPRSRPILAASPSVRWTCALTVGGTMPRPRILSSLVRGDFRPELLNKPPGVRATVLHRAGDEPSRFEIAVVWMRDTDLDLL